MSESQIETVRAIAELARLDIDAGEAEALARQFAHTLERFEALRKLDVEGVEPMRGAPGGANVLREDRPEPSLSPDAILANAPARVDDFYRVPKTVGGDE
jgi:aspartyl-tRNA(Asn)/glutamyl-tRNA(Gln) amidotransferase subunit C